MREMRLFIKNYLDHNKKLKILDVGSLCLRNKNNSYFSYKRYFLDNPNWKYTGLDIVSGDGVDIVVDDMYNYPIESNSYDVVISGSTMEHVIDIYKWVKELSRITNNLLFILVPNTAPEHKHPVDCWRVFPDGMNFILKEISGMEILECKKSNNDTVGVAKKIKL